MVPSRSTKATLGPSATRAIAAAYLVCAAGSALIAIVFDVAWSPYATLLLLPVLIVAAVDAFRTVSALAEDWRGRQLGANVKRALAALGPRYRIVTRGATSSDRDSHVAIGPNGIFLIVSSDDGGRVTASDQRLFVNARLPWRNLVEDCRVEALRVGDRVQRALGRPMPIHGVLCFTRALVAVGQEIRGVKIVQVPRLARLIESVASPVSLSDAEVEAARVALVASVSSSPVRPVFRITRRRQAVSGERALSLVGRASTPHTSRR
jgi:hypothetical protein